MFIWLWLFSAQCLELVGVAGVTIWFTPWLGLGWAPGLEESFLIVPTALCGSPGILNQTKIIDWAKSQTSKCSAISIL